WLLVGDFNLVLYGYEKKDGNPILYSSANNFRNFMLNNGLMDMGYNGDIFTWTNCQSGEGRIKERLERALCNNQWRLDYDQALLYHEHRIGLDHRPIKIELYHDISRNRIPFRFDARWLNKEECGLIIHGNWPADGLLNESFRACAKKAEALAKMAHEEATMQESSIKARLERLAVEPGIRQNVNEERALTIQLNKLWDDENTAWRQRSRIQWDREGDRNTRFFHSTTI
ncbi:hypothetical protein LINGRAPRIM_LOCUS306, partial [Linum grandiflorum]